MRDETIELKTALPPGSRQRPASECRVSKNPKDLAGSVKPPLSLVPMVAIVEESKVLRHGADKYGPYNWRSERIGVSAYVSATLRHLLSFADGETHDPESGLCHLAHARATLGILIDAMSLDAVIDDRPPRGAGPDALREGTA